MTLVCWRPPATGRLLNRRTTAEISHESAGCGQFLLEYLLDRLQVESCHVKIKVTAIMIHEAFKMLS